MVTLRSLKVAALRSHKVATLRSLKSGDYKKS